MHVMWSSTPSRVCQCHMVLFLLHVVVERQHQASLCSSSMATKVHEIIKSLHVTHHTSGANPSPIVTNAALLINLSIHQSRQPRLWPACFSVAHLLPRSIGTHHGPAPKLSRTSRHKNPLDHCLASSHHSTVATKQLREGQFCSTAVHSLATLTTTRPTLVTTHDPAIPPT